MTATSPQQSLNPANGLGFGNVNLTTSSAARSFLFNDTATTEIYTLSLHDALPISGDFSQTNTCASSIVAGGSCTIAVTFSPQAAGARSASITLTDSAANSPQTVALTRTGTPPPEPQYPSNGLWLRHLKHTTRSTARSFFFNDSATTEIYTLSLPDALPISGDFSQTNTCASSIVAGGSCTIAVTFSPQAAGARSASITLTDSAANSPQTVALT